MNVELRKTESGFSLVEVIVAIFVVTIALLGTAAAITSALQYSTLSRSVSRAKHLVVSGIEEVESVRNSRRLEFRQIANEGLVDNIGAARNFTGFVGNFADVSTQPGPDGVFGSQDDFHDPGPDLVYFNADDINPNPQLALGGFSRQVLIALPDPNDASFKRVSVTVRYLSAGGVVGELNGVSYINDDTRQTNR